MPWKSGPSRAALHDPEQDQAIRPRVPFWNRLPPPSAIATEAGTKGPRTDSFQGRHSELRSVVPRLRKPRSLGQPKPWHAGLGGASPRASPRLGAGLSGQETGERPVCPQVSPETGERPVCPQVSPKGPRCAIRRIFVSPEVPPTRIAGELYESSRARLAKSAEQYPYSSAAGGMQLDAVPQGLKPFA
jgi:hypothetical protein